MLENLEQQLKEIRAYRNNIHKLAETSPAVKCCLVLEGLTSGDCSVKDLEGVVYKYTHAVTSSCEHKDWLEAMEQDYKMLKENGII